LQSVRKLQLALDPLEALRRGRATLTALAATRPWNCTFPGPTKNTISDQTIHVAGTLAYGHNIQTGEFTGKDGSKVKIVVRTTDIYRKVNGKWLIVEEHNSVPVDLDTMKPVLLSKP
jgi:ketosteroid isomerase-like protein